MTDLEINEAFGKPMYEADPTNARYNSLQLQCYEQRKEIDRLNEHITELENRLRALWDKYYGDLNHHMGRIKRLEREVELFRKYSDYGDVDVVDSILRGEEIDRKENKP